MKCDQRATHTGFTEGRQFWFCAEHTFSDFQTIQGNSGIQCQRGDQMQAFVPQSSGDEIFRSMTGAGGNFRRGRIP